MLVATDGICLCALPFIFIISSGPPGALINLIPQSSIRSTCTTHCLYFRRKRVSTLPRSFTMPSEPESRDLPYIRQRSSRLSSRNTRPLSGSMKTPIGANMHDPSSSDYHNDEDNHERTPVNEYRGSSAPPESAYGYYTGSSGSEREYSSRESSTTPIQSPVGHGSSRSRLRSGSGSPRSSMSPPPVAPKPSGRSRERAWSQKRKGTGRLQQYSGSAGAMEKECKPRVIKGNVN